MSNSLVLIPCADDHMRSWLESQEIEPPEAVGTLPTPALLERILREADWPFQRNGSGEGWDVVFLPRGERFPPISDLSLLDGAVGFRLGPLYGPFHVAREVARHCGPQVAVEGSGAYTCLVLPSTTYEEFHLRIAEVAPPLDGLDREWSQPLPDKVKFAQAVPEERLASPEAALEYALSGRPGYGQAAISLGAALRDHLLGNPALRPSQTLDDARYDALVERLREHVRSAAEPVSELVWALDQVDRDLGT